MTDDLLEEILFEQNWLGNKEQYFDKKNKFVS